MDVSGWTRRGFLSAAALGLGAFALRGGATTEPGLRFLVLSDTHVGRAGDAARLERLIPLLRRERPAFILHAGDLLHDGVRRADHVAEARRLLRLMPAPVLLVPGNHDVLAGNPADAVRRWRAAFGPSERVLEHGGWRVVGFDAQALRAGSSDARGREEVLGFLERSLTEEACARTVLVQHLPELTVPIQAAQVPWHAASLRRFQTLLSRAPPALRVAGHWHVPVRVPGGSGLVIAPPVSSLFNLATGYLRCTARSTSVEVAAVMVDTAGKRVLPLVVRMLALPTAAPPS